MAEERMKSLCCINCYAVVMTASRAVGRFPHLSGKRQITNYVAVIERTVQKSAPGGVQDAETHSWMQPWIAKARSSRAFL